MNHKFLLLFLVCTISLLHCVPNILATPVIGGFVDRRHKFKYNVSIHKINLETSAYEFFCGGTIIHEKYIVTAAHCFMRKKFHEVTKVEDLTQVQPKIRAGTNLRDGFGIENDIVKIFIPKSYKDVPVTYADVAVAKLRDNLNLVRNKNTIEQKLIGQIPVNEEATKEATFCGFGYYDFENGHDGRPQLFRTFSEINRFLTVQLLGTIDCPTFESEICARSFHKSELQTACFGDSGAGLIFNNRVIGVLSYGPQDCDTPTIPIRFTRVWEFSSFIEQATNEGAENDDMDILERRLTPHQSPLHHAGPSRASHAH